MSKIKSSKQKEFEEFYEESFNALMNDISDREESFKEEYILQLKSFYSSPLNQYEDEQ